METRTTVRSQQALGQELARLRFERGLTQEELADAIGVSRRYIWMVEGGRPNVYADRLFELLRELGGHIEVVDTHSEGTSSAHLDLTRGTGDREPTAPGQRDQA